MTTAPASWQLPLWSLIGVAMVNPRGTHMSTPPNPTKRRVFQQTKTADRGREGGRESLSPLAKLTGQKLYQIHGCQCRISLDLKPHHLTFKNICNILYCAA